MRRRAWISAFCIVVLTGCAADDPNLPAARPTASPAASDATPARPDFGRGRVLIDAGDDSVLLDVEIADTPEKHAYGLMFKRSLPADEGMVFVFFEDPPSGFWMKNTFIPLSIAFFDEEGRIVRIMDMDPCRTEECPTYEPGVAYSGALEVNQGSFERWGVSVGDRITVTQ